nr:phage integrase SAM-like domain-containing protein [Saprospiraceae bacterium]
MRISFRYNRKNKLDDQGKALIQMRLYLAGKEKYFSTGIYIKPQEWDQKRGKVKNHKFALEMNLSMTRLEERAFSLFYELNDQGSAILDKIINRLKGGEQDNDFIQFVKERIKGNEELAESTLRQHTLFINYLESFKSELPYAEITYSHLVKFEEFLLRSKSVRGGTLSR